MIRFYALLKKSNKSESLYCYDFLASDVREAIKKSSERAKLLGKGWRVYGGPCISKSEQ